MPKSAKHIYAADIIVIRTTRCIGATRVISIKNAGPNERNKIDPFSKLNINDNTCQKLSWSSGGKPTQTVPKSALTANKVFLCLLWKWNYQLLLSDQLPRCRRSIRKNVFFCYSSVINSFAVITNTLQWSDIVKKNTNTEQRDQKLCTTSSLSTHTHTAYCANFGRRN